ncbi:MAG: TolC family protein [Bacteroidales bacterium]|jgi:outer membrane protein TolC|nr:TolC family protein [Bacteroidales bacterium]
MIRIIGILCLSALSCSVFGQGDSLDIYLKTAGDNHPAVRAAFYAYEAALQRIPQAGALNDPQLETGFFFQPMNIVDGRQIADFRLMQMFPWFGGRKAARTEAEHMAKMAFEQFRETRDNLCLEIYTRWYALCRLQQQLSYIRNNREWLQQMEMLALRKYQASAALQTLASGEGKRVKASEDANSTGNGMGGMNMYQSSGNSASGNLPENDGTMTAMNMGSSTTGMAGVLLIRIEAEELDNNIENLEAEILAEKARFNVLLNRPAESAVIIPDTLRQTVLADNTDGWIQTVVQQNPMLKMLEEERLSYEAKTEMNRKMGYPMFGIGLEYMLIGKTKEQTGATSMMNSMNGKDMIMPMVSISIPLYRNKYRAAQRESLLLRKATDEKYTDILNQLQAELYRYKQQTDNATRNITLYRKQVSLTYAACELLLREFSSGKASLSDIVQMQRRLLDYRLKETDAVADYNIAAANIRNLMSQLYYFDNNE